MSRDLEQRVASLRAYCERRIQQCRREEATLGPRSSLTYEAVAERWALASVLEQLGFEVPARDEADLRGRGTAALAREIGTGQRSPRRRHDYEPDGAGGCAVCGESAGQALRPGGCAARRDSHSAPGARGSE